MLSNHFILCHSFLLLPSIFFRIRVFSNEYSGLISLRIDWFDLLAVHGTLKSLLQHHNWKTSILQHSALVTNTLTLPRNITQELYSIVLS